jgi:hypothetical protein
LAVVQGHYLLRVRGQVLDGIGDQLTGLTRDETLVGIGVRIDNRLEEGVSIAVRDPQPSPPDASQDVIRAMPRDLSKPREEAPRIAQFAEIAPR